MTPAHLDGLEEGTPCAVEGFTLPGPRMDNLAKLQAELFEGWAMQVVEGLCPWCDAPTLQRLTEFGVAYGAYVKCERCRRCYRAVPHDGRTALTILNLDAMAADEDGSALTLL